MFNTRYCTDLIVSIEIDCVHLNESSILHPPQQLEGDAQVVAEVEVLLHVNDIVAVVSVSSPHGI